MNQFPAERINNKTIQDQSPYCLKSQGIKVHLSVAKLCEDNSQQNNDIAAHNEIKGTKVDLKKMPIFLEETQET